MNKTALIFFIIDFYNSIDRKYKIIVSKFLKSLLIVSIKVNEVDKVSQACVTSLTDIYCFLLTF